MNYSFVNIRADYIVRKELYQSGVFVKIFKMSDSKVIPEGCDEVLYHYDI
ncbi:MAG: hypothetical protein L3J08_01730 [Flavobacteriaceae bacterium]|nr:hypothetical protein [Flavobacteriaceae bacterium]